MQGKLRSLIVSAWLATALVAAGATGKVIKVLPFHLDAEGRHALSPSLYDRDAYQAELRKHPEQRGGLRFDVQWKATKAEALKLKIELRSMKEKQPQTHVFEIPLKKSSAFASWTKHALTGENYQKLGEISAWRVTLWAGDTLLDEQSSFLWQAMPEKKNK